MTKKRRKSLNDTLAEQFVYGDELSAEPEPPPNSQQEPQLEPEKSQQNKSLMDKLQTEAKEPTKRFTIDLAESLHRKLSLLSARTGKSKADIVRILLCEALQDVEE